MRGDCSTHVVNPHGKAMVLFDFDGCGERHLSPQDLETSLETQFANQGWGSDRVTFVVIEPELEAWLFGASFRQIERAVGWSETQSIRGWLIERGYLTPGVIQTVQSQGRHRIGPLPTEASSFRKAVRRPRPHRWPSPLPGSRLPKISLHTPAVVSCRINEAASL